jgi:uncharacterized protein (TIGR03084 family)
MTDLLTGLLDDLAAESADLEAALDGVDWNAPTPAPGWSVATQVAHLLWTDEVATLAAHAHEEPDGKAAWDAVVLEAIEDPTGYVDARAHAIAAQPREEVLARWSRSRAGLREALLALPEGVKMPWFGPPMSAASMATARFMETWAHALDVHDAAGTHPEPTDRIRHVAYLGVRTRGFAFATRGEPVPEAELRVELTAPSGAVWSWGPEEAPESVRGSAYDFCRLATQRVHRADTDLVATGPGAERWLEIAQAFAGPPGPGREAAS